MTASALFTKNTTDDDHHKVIKTQLLQEDEHQKKPNKLIIAFLVTSIIIAVVTALTIAIFMLTDQRSGLRQVPPPFLNYVNCVINQFSCIDCSVVLMSLCR